MFRQAVNRNGACFPGAAGDLPTGGILHVMGTMALLRVLPEIRSNRGMQAAGGYSGPSYFTTKLRVWGFDVSPRLTAPECISKTRLLVTLIPCVDLSQSAARCLASNNVAPS